MARKTQGNLYREMHRRLKKLGIGEGALKKSENYSTSERRKISALYKKFQQEADWAAKPHSYQNNPAQTFSSRPLKNRAEIQAAKESGLKVYKNRVIIKHRAAEKIRLVRYKTHLSEGKKVLQVERKIGGVIRRDQIATRTDILQMLSNMGDQTVGEATAGKYGFVTVRIADNNPWASQRMTYAELLKYITKEWDLNDVKGATKRAQKEKKQELIDLMTIVYSKG